MRDRSEIGVSLRRYAAVAILGSLVLLAPTFAAAQDYDDLDAIETPTPDPVQVALETRTQTILEEIADDPAHRWAGEYFFGDGMGTNVNLVLAPQSGVTATWDGCMGRYASALGDVKDLGDGTLQAHYQQRHEASALGFPQRLIPVRWGERRYLMDADKAIDFINAINFGNEPRSERHGRVLLARGDEALDAPGLPTLPSPYREMIRAQERDVGVIAAKIESQERTDDSCSTTFHLTLDHGADIGLVPGSELRVTRPRKWETIHVLEVSATSATAEYMSFAASCAPLDPAPGPGWVFTTGGLDLVAREAEEDE